MLILERTSAENLRRHIRGRLLAGSSGQAWRDVLVHILSHQQVKQSLVVPAVAEPLIVWILSGSAVIDEREQSPGSLPAYERVRRLIAPYQKLNPRSLG